MGLCRPAVSFSFYRRLRRVLFWKCIREEISADCWRSTWIWRLGGVLSLWGYQSMSYRPPQPGKDDIHAYCTALKVIFPIHQYLVFFRHSCGSPSVINFDSGVDVPLLDA